jgi:hypothetical protein
MKKEVRIINGNAFYLDPEVVFHTNDVKLNNNDRNSMPF